MSRVIIMLKLWVVNKMRIGIKGLLKHVYPSCNVIVYNDQCEYVTNVGDYYNVVDDDEYCDDFAFYENHLAIFIA